MIVALSGKIKSGKNTVANIIQYLTSNYTSTHTYEQFLIDVQKRNDYPEFLKWQQVAFAAKLKQIVALLIGCTVEQLEDQEFKSSPLGKEWRRFYYYHYKLRTDSNNGRVSPYFSTYEEAMLYNFPKLDGVPIWGKDSLWIEEEELTPRLLLQLIGTEGLRNLIHPNSHINGLFADYKPLVSYQGIIMNLSNNTIQESDYKLESEFPNWIITDVRFPNEVEAIKDRGGIIIRVNREDNTGQGKLNPHTSETALDDYEFDYIIDNFGTIEQLKEKVKTILIKEQLL